MSEEIIQTFYGKVGIGITDPSDTLEASSIKVTNLTVNGVSDAFAPTGLIIMWSGGTIPSGWALCDGADGRPDFQDKFIVSYGSSYTINNTGGNFTKTITTSIMASHSHTYDTDPDGGHGHTISMQSSGLHGHALTTGQAGSHKHPSTFAAAVQHAHPGSTGQGGSHTHNCNTNFRGNHTHGIQTRCRAFYRNCQNTANRADYSCGEPNQYRYYSQHNTDGNHGHNYNGTGSYGAHTHPHTIGQAGSHTHPISCSNAANHTHTVSTASANHHSHGITLSTVQKHTHTFQTNNTGAGSSFNISPPYYVLAFIIKT